MATTGIAKLERYGLLLAAGDDARAFLHAQLTNDLEHLAAGQARHAGWCTAQGRLLATFLVIPTSTGILLQLSKDLVPAVLKRLSMFILRSKVKLTDVTAQWAQLGVWDGGTGGNLQVIDKDGEIEVAIEPGRKLLLVPAASAAKYAAGTSEADWLLAEIRAGRALIEKPTQDQFVPQMVNLELSGGVDFRKGCYPGQEIVARAQYRGSVKRRMFRLRGEALQPGQELFADDAPGHSSGMVVNAAGDEALAVLQVSSVEAKAPIRARPDAAPLQLLSLPYAQ